jgi:glycosyltransferase involved in cell wall biosynthesis
VDDGSRDDTTAVLAEFGDRVTCIRQDNRGPSAARNVGIQAARGRYVCTLDSDDLWFPWTLPTFAQVVEATHWPAMVAGHLRPFRSEGELAAVSPEVASYEVFPDYLAASSRGYFVGSGMALYSRESLAKVGTFDPTLINLEDHDLALRMGAERGFVKITRPFTVAYRQHAGSIQNVVRSTEGLWTCMDRERNDQYPGGPARGRERRRVIGLHSRPLSLACVREGRSDLGWRLYRASVSWNLREGRIRYLMGFPLIDLVNRVRRWFRAARPRE